MNYGKRLIGGAIAAAVAYFARTVFLAVHSYDYQADPSGYAYFSSFTVDLAVPGVGLILGLVIAAFGAGFLFTLLITRRSLDSN